MKDLRDLKDLTIQLEKRALQYIARCNLEKRNKDAGTPVNPKLSLSLYDSQA